MISIKKDTRYPSAKHSVKHFRKREQSYLGTSFQTNKMSASNINLNELYFEYKVLPRIVGEPTFNHLHEILKQLKANTCAVPCTLGGDRVVMIAALIAS